MKKLVTKSIKVLLILLILIFALFACEQNVLDENLPNDESGEDQPSGDNTQVAGVELTDKDSDLIATLVEYLKKTNVQIDLVGSTLEQKINKIKNGDVHPLLVDVDSNNYYFVCCYYDSSRNDEKLIGHRNASEYTWVKYEGVESIKEKYNNKNFIRAFQINKSLIVKNILSGDEDTKMDYFTTLSVEFVDGANVNPANVVSETFIYLCKSINSTIYYSHSIKGSSVDRIHCMKLDNQYYFPWLIGFTDPQVGYTDHLEDEISVSDLGEYYDDMIKIMIVNKYSETFSENGVNYTYHYGLFEIWEFTDAILK